MRKKKKKFDDNETAAKSEASFLRRRRKAVAKAAAASTSSRQPKWMKKMAQQLWSKELTAELNFNSKKYHKKAVVAYKAGMLKPKTSAEKRKLTKDLAEHEKSEKKRRQEYDRSIAKRF